MTATLVKISLTACLLSLASCSFHSADSDGSRLVKENADRTTHYHKLNDAVARAQADLQDYLTGEVKKCEAKGQIKTPPVPMTLQMTPQGDLTCSQTPKQAQAPPASQPPTPAPPASASPATPEKK